MLVYLERSARIFKDMCYAFSKVVDQIIFFISKISLKKEKGWEVPKDNKETTKQKGYILKFNPQSLTVADTEFSPRSFQQRPQKEARAFALQDTK